MAVCFVLQWLPFPRLKPDSTLFQNVKGTHGVPFYFVSAT
jgi:hypothetical protein